MLIEFSKLDNLPVFELETQTRVGQFADFFIDEDEYKVEAAIVSAGGLIKKQKFVSAKEISELSKEALIIDQTDSLVEPKEMVRFQKKLKKRAKIIGEKVYTKKGEYLGNVYDYVLENTTLSIVRIYLRKMFDQRIIHSSAIVKVEQHKITVKDNFEMVKPEPLPSGAHAKMA